MRALVVLGLLCGCGSEYEMSSTPDPVEAPVVGPAEVPASAPTPPKTPVHTPPLALVPVEVGQGSSARSAREDTKRNIREEVFDGGSAASTSLADYLFVIDNSSSMDRILGQVRRGLMSLSGGRAFPAQARIAVMSTMPASPESNDTVHPVMRVTDGLADDPGFLRLVDAEGIAAYRQRAPQMARRFALDGCTAWFTPFAQNDQGTPCLMAHTQTGRTSLRVEAGLVALKQWLTAASEPVFRPGAAANVVFISDTHDPGVPLDLPGAASLRELRPTFPELLELVEANSLVSSFRIHAVAPATECVERWSDGATYRDAALASGGVFVDVCTATNYRPVLRQIAEQGAQLQRAVFPLGRSAAVLESVTVDDRPVGYSVSSGGRVLVLDDRPSERRAKVVVRYGYENRP